MKLQPERLNAHYSSLEASFAHVQHIPRLASLVTANGNDKEPIHRWFGFKEAFSSQLIATLLRDHQLEAPRRFLDPFLGSGTSLVSLVDLVESGATLSGREVNPFIEVVARAKVAGALATETLVGEVRAAHAAVLADSARTMGRTFKTYSSTLNNRDYFSESGANTLLAIGRSILDNAEGDVRAVLQTSLGAAVEPSSKLRKDGRALRYQSAKEPVDPMTAYKVAMARALEDMEVRAEIARPLVTANILRASATASGLNDGENDLAVFSPPYPNNIDYTEVYKLESWVIGAYSTTSDMREQREKSLRSHPSIKFAEEYKLNDGVHKDDFKELVAPILAAIPEGRYSLQRRRTVQGYVDDMSSTMKVVQEQLRPGGRAFCIVANSKHGQGSESFEVASDLLIARVGEFAGLDVNDISIARYPTRRSSSTGFLRESIVHFQKPLTVR